MVRDRRIGQYTAMGQLQAAPDNVEYAQVHEGRPATLDSGERPVRNRPNSRHTDCSKAAPDATFGSLILISQ